VAARGVDPLLAKPVRAGWLPARAGTCTGRGHRGVVPRCPLGTGQYCCEWHASGTAGEDHVARSLATPVIH
jgi:hypothetical protein